MRYGTRLSVCVVTAAVIAAVSFLALVEATPGETAPDGRPSLESPIPTVPPSQLRGDLNCDDSVDPRDSLALLRADAGLDLDVPVDCLGPNVEVDGHFIQSGFPIFERADLNCDESVDPRDSLFILRHDAGLDWNLPASCFRPNAEVWLA